MNSNSSSEDVVRSISEEIQMRVFKNPTNESSSFAPWNKPRFVECCHFSYPEHFYPVSSAGPRSKFKRGNITTHFVRATCLSTKRVYHQYALRHTALRASPHRLFTGAPRTGTYCFCDTFPPPPLQMRGSAVSRFRCVRVARTFLSSI